MSPVRTCAGFRVENGYPDSQGCSGGTRSPSHCPCSASLYAKLLGRHSSHHSSCMVVLPILELNPSSAGTVIRTPLSWDATTHLRLLGRSDFQNGDQFVGFFPPIAYRKCSELFLPLKGLDTPTNIPYRSGDSSHPSTSHSPGVLI